MGNKKTALIIGAGPAGLTAAYKLLEETDIHPIVIEKEDFIGGISRTVNYKGNRIDIGGHRFFTKNGQVQEIWDKFMPVQGEPSIDDKILNNEKPLNVGGPNPENEDNIFLIRTRVSRILYLRKFFDYPISLKLKTILNLGLLNTTKAGIGYVWSSIFKIKEDSLEDFMINRFGTSLYKIFFKDYTEKVWGKKPSEISASWGAQRIKGLSLSKALISVITKPFRKKDISQKNIETSLIENFFYPKKGPGQFWETMASNIIEKGGQVLLNTNVDKISIVDGKINTLRCISNGNTTELSADYIFSSMPICDLVKSIDAEVPKEVYDVATNLPYRDFITVGLLVNKLKIKNTTNIKTVSNIVPDCWIYIQEPDVKVGRMQIFNNWSPYMVKDLENTVWIGLEYFCNEGDELWQMPDDEFINFAIDEVVKIGIADKEDILDQTRIKVNKAYPAYFGIYDKFDTVKNYLNSIDNLYCIGRNGQHRYNNMDHSMLTAIEAVNSIITGGEKEKMWNVNTEEDYHEQKGISKGEKTHESLNKLQRI
jgi:protoporphyrinogen oxidase